jgi:hypothetical protein
MIILPLDGMMKNQTINGMVMAGVEGAFSSLTLLNQKINLNPSPVSCCIRPEMSIGNLTHRFHIPSPK